MKLIANKKINTGMLGNLPTQLADIFALFERDLFKNGLQSLYNAAVINAKGNDHCMEGIKHFQSSNLHLQKQEQTGNKVINEKENGEKFGFRREQKRSKRRAPRNNGGSPFNALTILLLIVSGLRLARAAADNIAMASTAPSPTTIMVDDTKTGTKILLFTFGPVIAAAILIPLAMGCYVCYQNYCQWPYSTSDSGNSYYGYGRNGSYGRQQQHQRRPPSPSPPPPVTSI